MSKPWSKLKSRLEGLWAPELRMAIHTTAYRHPEKSGGMRIPRHWITLEDRIIWDFPADFLFRKNPEHPAAFDFLLEHYQGGSGHSSAPAGVIRQYIDCPVEAVLTTQFEYDHWSLGDVLRAADRRLGKSRLRVWAAGLTAQNPAHQVLVARFDSPLPAPG